MRYILVIVIGAMLGYALGFRDGRVHSKHVVARMLDQVGGANRRNMSNDLDRKLDSLSRDSVH